MSSVPGGEHALCEEGAPEAAPGAAHSSSWTGPPGAGPLPHPSLPCPSVLESLERASPFLYSLQAKLPSRADPMEGSGFILCSEVYN